MFNLSDIDLQCRLSNFLERNRLPLSLVARFDPKKTCERIGMIEGIPDRCEKDQHSVLLFNIFKL